MQLEDIFQARRKPVAGVLVCVQIRIVACVLVFAGENPLGCQIIFGPHPHPVAVFPAGFLARHATRHEPVGIPIAAVSVIGVEENTDIKVENEDITLENFGSINQIYDFIEKNKNQ